MNRSSYPLSLLIPLLLGCFALSPQARATCQEGCDTVTFNTFLGDDALVNNTTGFGNTAIGSSALASNTTGTTNTATGYAALYSNTTGYLNTATGAGALDQNTTGYSNTANGSSALASNTTGINNTASGYAALYSNTTGSFNTAIGEAALTFNTTGYLNTATGADALDQNTTGYSNTANGSSALLVNTSGTENTATGASAVERNTTGSENTASGFHALLNNTTGNNNIALGANAGLNLTTGDDDIDIGNAGFAGESSKIRIGTEGTHTATYIAGINEAPLVHGAAVAVGITPDGQLGVRASSERFKKDIAAMDKTSEAIMSLRPVTFHYKADTKDTQQFGLVAEEVAKVNPDLVLSDREGKPYTVRYESVNAMLLNEFLKEHCKVEELEAALRAVNARLAEQDAKIQKVSTQLELSKSALQTAADNQ